MRRRVSIRPEMNVTPLVDVVLVLLIIFMVIAPQMEAGAAVDLPGVVHPDGKNEEAEPLTLSLTADGRTFVDKEPLADDALRARLADEHARSPGRRVVLKADRAARWVGVRGVFKTCHDLGFPGVSLQVGDLADAARNEGR